MALFAFCPCVFFLSGSAVLEVSSEEKFFLLFFGGGVMCDVFGTLACVTIQLLPLSSDDGNVLLIIFPPPPHCHPL